MSIAIVDCVVLRMIAARLADGEHGQLPADAKDAANKLHDGLVNLISQMADQEYLFLRKFHECERNEHRLALVKLALK